MKQMSTALSDLAVAITAFGTAIFLLGQNTYACVGFLLMGVAASCGTYRFSCTSPSSSAVARHQTLSWLATILGMSLIASGFHRQYKYPVMSSIHIGSAIAVICIQKKTDIFSPPTQKLLESVVSSAAVVSMAVFSILHTNPFGILGAVSYAIAGVIGTEGDLVGIRRVDWFHYVLAFGNAVFLRAFTYTNPQTFYREN